MDDITFGRSGLYGDAWKLAALQYPGRVWCLWMPCVFLFYWWPMNIYSSIAAVAGNSALYP